MQNIYVHSQVILETLLRAIPFFSVEFHPHEKNRAGALPGSVGRTRDSRKHVTLDLQVVRLDPMLGVEVTLKYNLETFLYIKIKSKSRVCYH